MSDTSRGWLWDIVVGGVAGGVAGAIMAMNVVIFSGIEGGYEAGLGDVFRQNVVVGVATVLLWISGPVTGVIVARRLRARRAQT